MQFRNSKNLRCCIIRAIDEYELAADFFNLLFYADFDYCKGLCYPNCKVKNI